MEHHFKKEISVIIPVFNEAENIKELIERLSKTLKKDKFSYQIIVVDDNSTDKTVSKVKKIARANKVTLLSKKGKKGKAYSLIEGFSKAKFKNIGFIDADLQYPPEEIVKMSLKLKSADIVCANRRKYEDSLFRKILSRSFKNLFGKLLFKLNYDIQAGLKVMKREVIETVKFVPTSAWTYDLELLYKAKMAGFKIQNHDIIFSKREKGASKIGVLKTVKDIGIHALILKARPLKPIKVSSHSKKTMRGAGFRFKGKRYITHSTLHHTKSSISTFSRIEFLLITLIIAVFLAGLILSPVLTLIFSVGILSFIYFSDTLFNLYIILNSLHFPQEINIENKELKRISERKLPIYTILCPLYKEAHIIPQFVKSIKKLSWPKSKLDVMLLLEEDDKESISKIKKMNLPKYIRVVVVPDSQPKTKPKACNYGLSYAKGEYLVVYDAEDMPEAFQLKKAFLAFQKIKRDIVCLQAKLNYYNPNQNLLTRFFTAEYSLWFDVILTGLQSINTSIPLGGTSNHFRTKDIIKLQGWDPFNVTEDADLGIRLFKDGYKTAIINSTTFEEANSKWGNWLRQRSRWIKGYMQTYLVHVRDSFKFAKNKGKHYPIFHLIIGGKIAFILINPILWVATISYFALYGFVGPTIEKLYPGIIFYMAVFSLVFGNFLFMYYYMIGIMKRQQYSLVKYTFLVPFYWLMISLAGFVALYQLVFKPFYWEKTVHGFHLLKKEAKENRKAAAGKTRSRKAITGFGFPTPGFALVLSLLVIGNVENVLVRKAFKVSKENIVKPLKFAISLFM
jgi:cellulose synthase/poly-beta-1,6-N-acetylglucosamine synthase-like glycosyltransferase